MKNKDDEETENKVDFGAIVVEADENEIIDIESNTNALPANNINKKEEVTKKKYEEIDRRNKRIIRNTIALLECNDICKLNELVIAAISAIDNIVNGSLMEHKKIKSFLGRWNKKLK